ncbi:MAG: histidine phosphatase family protein [Thiohalocapsa sp.]
MPRELLILRHAKSEWDRGAVSDYDRPLAKRGRKDAPVVGAWLYREGMVPDYLVSSTAQRAQETALRVCKALDFKKKRIVWDDAIYEADLNGLLGVLNRVPADAATVLLVGHNPGLEELTRFLTGNDFDEPDDGKLLPTAALARLEMPDDWSNLKAGCAALLSVARPKQLK